LLLNFPLEYAIRRVQVSHNDLNLDGTHQLLVYADDANILEGSVHTIKKNIQALAVACEKTGLEVNAEKTKHMVIYRDYNAKLNMKMYNESFEKVEQ
jgi:hypothetical protein